MQEVHTPPPIPSTPNASEEILIERKITFRNSTFGGLKAFIRNHERRTGQHLSNAAAVDTLLRQALTGHIHPHAMAEMRRMSRPGSAEALQAISPDDPTNAPAEPTGAPHSARVAPLEAIRVTSHGTRSGPSVINLQMPKRAPRGHT